MSGSRESLRERLAWGWRQGWKPTLEDGGPFRDRVNLPFHAFIVAAELLFSELDRAGFLPVRPPPALRRKRALFFEDLHPDLSGFRIAHLSDLHMGYAFRAADLEKLARRVRDEEPDLVVVTGDFVNRSAGDLAGTAAGFDALRAPLGLYGVPGNHDRCYGQTPALAALEDLGVELLVNRGVLLRKGRASLYVGGIDDLTDGEADLGATFAGAQAGAFTLLLSHTPDVVNHLDGFFPDLILAGHTHGGQIVPPGPLRLAVPKKSRYLAGLYAHGSSLLHVSRGVGYVGIPWRFGSPAEFHILELRRGKRGKNLGRFSPWKF